MKIKLLLSIFAVLVSLTSSAQQYGLVPLSDTTKRLAIDVNNQNLPIISDTNFAYIAMSSKINTYFIRFDNKFLKVLEGENNKFAQFVEIGAKEFPAWICELTNDKDNSFYIKSYHNKDLCLEVIKEGDRMKVLLRKFSGNINQKWLFKETKSDDFSSGAN